MSEKAAAAKKYLIHVRGLTPIFFNESNGFIYKLFLYKKPGLLFIGLGILESPSAGEITK